MPWSSPKRVVLLLQLVLQTQICWKTQGYLNSFKHHLKGSFTCALRFVGRNDNFFRNKKCLSIHRPLTWVYTAIFFIDTTYYLFVCGRLRILAVESAPRKFHISSRSLQSRGVVLVEVRVEVGLALLSVKGIGFFLHAFSRCTFWSNNNSNNIMQLLWCLFRFVNLMEGHIWIESEGLGKGCTATFIIKLGISSNSNDQTWHIASKARPVAGPDLRGQKPVKDENGVTRLRHQKSV